MNIHLFSFIRDEAYLLQKWIPYHASIIDIQNIHIIDHDSKDPECIHILKKYREKGLNVKTTTKRFSEKYKILTRLMQNQKSNADILIPLDADEFLCLADQNRHMKSDPEAIKKQLQMLPLNGKKYAFHVFESVLHQSDYKDPLKEIKYFQYFPASINANGANQQTKTFFPSKNFAYTDQGNHKGGVLLAPNDIYNISDMAIAHFHLRGYRHFISKFEKAIEAYQLRSLPPDYEGTGMRWNRWYHETKDLNQKEKRNWFIKNFVYPEKGTYQPSISNRFSTLHSAE